MGMIPQIHSPEIHGGWSLIDLAETILSGQLAARIYVAGCGFGYTETYHGKLLRLVDALYNLIYYIYIYHHILSLFRDVYSYGIVVALYQL